MCSSFGQKKSLAVKGGMGGLLKDGPLSTHHLALPKERGLSKKLRWERGLEAYASVEKVFLSMNGKLFFLPIANPFLVHCTLPWRFPTRQRSKTSSPSIAVWKKSRLKLITIIFALFINHLVFRSLHKVLRPPVRPHHGGEHAWEKKERMREG